MAMCRLNVPSVFMYGGSILPGKFKGKDVTVLDVFEGVGMHEAGKMSDKELEELELVACSISWCLRRTIHCKHNGMRV